ncbi:MAG: hypothetical protein ABS36_10020 [Acidobacteria bacterium SCN 69-37]|nr:MAG: hypothetical protein ABS36_10020 [Acidobacteria bacterium SCN 69-37]
MTEGHIGRLVAASLHQAISEALPQRLDFYENWLHSEGLRDGSIGRAPMMAVLGFLRTEDDDGYDRVVARAGALAAEWALMTLPAYRRRMVTWMPGRFRIGAALRVAAAIAEIVDSGSRLRVRSRGVGAEVEVISSVFCSVRGVQPAPLCGFYRALAVTTLAHFGLPSTAQVDRCRAMGAGSCLITVTLEMTRPIETTAAAA